MRASVALSTTLAALVPTLVVLVPTLAALAPTSIAFATRANVIEAPHEAGGATPAAFAMTAVRIEPTSERPTADVRRS